MSNLLTMEDFEGMEQSHQNMSSFEKLLLVASVAANKYDLANKSHQNVESNLGGDKKMVKKMDSLRFVTRRQYDEQKNLTSYVIVPPSKKHDESIVKTNASDQEDLIKAEKGKKVVDSEIDESSRKTKTPKRKLGESNEEWLKSMEKKNKKQGRQNPPLPPPPSLAEVFKRKIINEYGGTRIMRVIQKSLSSTDVNKGHSRVSIPFSQVESFNFLDDEELTHLRNKQPITVPLIHMPRSDGVSLPLKETSMKFVQWDMPKDKNDIRKISYMYALRSNWNEIVSTDELKQGDIIQIWTFRDGHNKLCMALVKL